MRTYLTYEMEFEVCSSDGCILMKPNMVIVLYVDDIIIVGVQDDIGAFISEFGKKFNTVAFDKKDSRIDQLKKGIDRNKEIEKNPRSRSAKLRVVRKISDKSILLDFKKLGLPQVSDKLREFQCV